MNFWVTVKKILYAKLEHYLTIPHTLPHEISALYIYIYIDDYSFITPNH